jgi:hypothetical protein
MLEMINLNGKELKIPKEDEALLLKIMSEFAQQFENHNELFPPSAELSSTHWLLSQMDKRLAEIEQAIDLIKR